MPEPPPRGPRGADRIKILEDTDGDGRADKATVFVDGLNLAQGWRSATEACSSARRLISCSIPTKPRRPARRRPRSVADRLRPPRCPRHGQLDDVGPRRLALRRAGKHGHGSDSRATNFSKASGDIIPEPAQFEVFAEGVATPGGSTSTRPATHSAAATAPTSPST